MKKLVPLRLFLYLIAAHSLIVGINLIVFPAEWMTEFGFGQISEGFFKAQGGVFHIVMAVAYSLAAWRPGEYRILIIFSIAAKLIATVFLFSYFLFINPVMMILLSGIGDLIMGLLLVFLFRKFSISNMTDNTFGKI